VAQAPSQRLRLCRLSGALLFRAMGSAATGEHREIPDDRVAALPAQARRLCHTIADCRLM
jgi:hypothetical protein